MDNDMNIRLKTIRKALDLNMKEFGSKLGVTASAISRLESGENKITESMLIAICTAYKININWLKYGKGEMFESDYNDYIDQLAKDYNFDTLEKSLLQGYLSLTEKQRSIFIQFLKGFLLNNKDIDIDDNKKDIDIDDNKKDE